MSDLDRFELFTHLAQSHSLTAAAQHLNLSKAALSKQIKRLESDLGMSLFSRAQYRLALTPQGEMLLAQTQRLQRELDDTRTLCQAFLDTPQGPLNVHTFDYFAKQWILPKLEGFMQRYPDISLTLSTHERIPDFHKEQVDLALGYSLPSPNSDDIVRRSMGTTYYVLCGTPQYFDKYGMPATLEALKTHRYISHTSRVGIEHALKLKKGHQLALTPTLSINRVTTMIDAALANIGLIQLPIYMLEDHLKNGTLVSVLPEYQRHDEHIYFYYPKYRFTQPKVRAFIDFFLL